MLFPTGMPIHVFWDLSASECYEVIFLTRRFNKALIYLPESHKCFPNFKHSTQANIFKQLYFVTVKHKFIKINKITLFCFSSKALGFLEDTVFVSVSKSDCSHVKQLARNQQLLLAFWTHQISKH